MIKPLENCFEACYYDGQAPVRQDARVQLYSAELSIAVAGREIMVWPYAGMRFAADGSYGEPVRIERERETLVIESRDFIEALRQHGIARSAFRIDLRSWPAVLLCCIAITVIASMLYVWGVKWFAEQSARLMPVGVEDRLGHSVVTILAPEETRCKDPIARRRLDPILERMRAAAGSDYDFRIIYVNQNIVNAFAAPGGYIVVFRGLLEQAETAEEFAGVLAHEMQHVMLRHSARAIAREFSGRALLALMAVDSSGTPAAIQAGARLANLSYQRADEEAADVAGVALLARARVRADGLLIFLRRLQTDFSAGQPPIKYLSTHPAMDERIEALQAETRKAAEPRAPLMTLDDWKIARAVCGAN